MFLGLDIGNTTVKAALHNGTAWGTVRRLPARERPFDEWTAWLQSFVNHGHAAGLCSVVPQLTLPLTRAVEEVTGQAPGVVLPSAHFPFCLAIRTPETLGTDRLAATAAATIAYGRDGGTLRPVIALTAGTAVTVNAVDATPDGHVFRGGAILPGPTLLQRGMAGGTAQLPQVPWKLPESPIGTITTEALQVGLATLLTDGLSGLLRRTSRHLSAQPVVVATGGWAFWLAEHIPRIDTVDALLVLEGVRHLTR